MIMIRAIIRPERAHAVMAALLEAGYPAVTKVSVHGRGKQRGLKVGDMHYDELPKEMLMLVADEEDQQYILPVIIKTARTGDKGAFGDGKIFVSPVDAVYTIRTGEQEFAIAPAQEAALEKAVTA